MYLIFTLQKTETIKINLFTKSFALTLEKKDTLISGIAFTIQLKV